MSNHAVFHLFAPNIQVISPIPFSPIMVADSGDHKLWANNCGDVRIQTNQTTANIIANQSQDYIDEQLAEFQEQIHRLQGRYLLTSFLFLEWLYLYVQFLIIRNVKTRCTRLIET